MSDFVISSSGLAPKCGGKCATICPSRFFAALSGVYVFRYTSHHFAKLTGSGSSHDEPKVVLARKIENSGRGDWIRTSEPLRPRQAGEASKCADSRRICSI